ncbi:ADP-ribosylglycohydrolase family protein [Lichenibacterium dinghuense]|uniref:ADP-ribosylglycohydrolase family protein n=1 Tax=Lichenibacterium dinghuense TaxID=2895977 RepID=UPI001F19B94F|nr:ADP-ribosylglycohydrolase family protein [Lichenibacterium sp. 6Y81]
MSDTDPDKPALLDRARGALLGLAVGDALGATLEFGPRIASVKDYHREMIGGGPFGLQPGEWTDDTAMMLALSKSLTLRKGFDPVDVMERWVSWYRTGEYSCTGTCFDIGGTTRAALERFERTGDPFAGSADEHTAANGSLMRVAPVALFGLDDEAEAVRIAREQSRLTHAHPACVSTCDYFVRLLRLFILGEEDPIKLALVKWSGHPEVQRAKAALWGGLKRKDARSTGYVIDTLESAFWAVSASGSFEQAVVLAVSLGGDSDTVGAVTGALAGAKWGERSIPERWLKPLAWRSKIGATALSLVRVSSEVHLHGL